MDLKFIIWLTSAFNVFDFIVINALFEEHYNQTVGCFSFNHINYQQINETEYAWSMEKCVARCLKDFYRYGGIVNASVCYCGSMLYTQGPSTCSLPCYSDKSEICGGPNAISLYSTGYLVPGPPDQVKEINITENVIGLRWLPPRATNGHISQYQIAASCLETFTSKTSVLYRSWLYPGNSTKAELLGLHAGTMYNISISAKNEHGIGKAVYRSIWTQIGTPPIPDAPEVLLTENNTIKLSLKPVVNENGPITSYRIVVSSDVRRLFTHEELKSWNSAQEEGSPFYIAAQLKPEEFSEEFIVGDGRRYGGFFNAPLSSTRDYHVCFGVVSTFDDPVSITKASYSNFTRLTNNQIFNSDTNDVADILNIILITAIIIGTLVLLLLITAYMYLRIKLGGRVRPRNLQEMVLRGPFIEMDNNAFIDDDEDNEGPVQNGFSSEVDVAGYNARPQSSFPLSSSGVFTLVGFVDKFFIDPTRLMVVEGHYGPIYECTAQKRSSSTKVQALTLKIEGEKINDEKLLNDLFVHTFCKHQNIIEILGMHIEPKSTYHIVMEHFGLTLKHTLIQYRSAIKKNFHMYCENIERFLLISKGVGEGLMHLHSREIMHNRLCARNILIENGTNPKIFNFGVSTLERPDEIFYARWQSPNRQTKQRLDEGYFSEENDIWSLGVLLWEIFSLGATPYIQLTNEELKLDRSRPKIPKLNYIPDLLNKIMQNCWLDSVEQLKLEEIVNGLKKMCEGNHLEEKLPSNVSDLAHLPVNLTVEGYSIDEQARFGSLSM